MGYSFVNRMIELLGFVYIEYFIYRNESEMGSINRADSSFIISESATRSTEKLAFETGGETGATKYQAVAEKSFWNPTYGLTLGSTDDATVDEPMGPVQNPTPKKVEYEPLSPVEKTTPMKDEYEPMGLVEKSTVTEPKKDGYEPLGPVETPMAPKDREYEAMGPVKKNMGEAAKPQRAENAYTLDPTEATKEKDDDGTTL